MLGKPLAISLKVYVLTLLKTLSCTLGIYDLGTGMCIKWAAETD
ncbi:Unknown protein sequence [Pseudomonas savastanoi pv. glycinea]|nr:Unknown protein sequence [Pseudomonas amygdali pv. myricae]KPC24112.1 Unknown protein sequence [Pseudomonas savastanoi pv. glycinea]